MTTTGLNVTGLMKKRVKEHCFHMAKIMIMQDKCNVLSLNDLNQEHCQECFCSIVPVLWTRLARLTCRSIHRPDFCGEVR